MRIERVLGLRVASAIALTDDPDPRANAYSTLFRLQPEAAQRPVAVADPLEIRTLDDTPYLRMGRIESGILLRFPAWADFVVSPDGSSITCTPLRESRSMRCVIVSTAKCCRGRSG